MYFAFVLRNKQTKVLSRNDKSQHAKMKLEQLPEFRDYKAEYDKLKLEQNSTNLMFESK